MAVVLRKKAPYTCRGVFEIPGVLTRVCAAILTEDDGVLCPACVNRKPGELKPIAVEPSGHLQEWPGGVEPKPHWPIWPGE